MEKILNRRKWQTGHVLEGFDIFGEPVPGFNVKGQDTVRTRTGGVLTLMITFTVLLYAGIRMNALTTRHNPNMSSHYEDISFDEVLNISDKDNLFKFAFTVEDFWIKERKDDPRYVKWFFRIYTINDGEVSHQEIPIYLCTEDDYAEFYPIQDVQTNLLEEIKQDPNRGFFCIDNKNSDLEDQLILFGEELQRNYQRLEFIMMPCNGIYTELGHIEGDHGQVSEECEPDLDQQIKYIGEGFIMLYINQVRFLPEEYGEARLKKYSEIVKQHFDTKKPSWFLTTIQKTDLEDETEYLQFGFEDKVSFLTFEKQFPETSAWRQHPTKNPTGLYKFISFETNLSQKRLVFQRETYDFLSWLGDIGGLTDCLIIIGKLILAPYTSYGLQTFLLSRLFRLQPLKTHKGFSKSLKNLKLSNLKKEHIDDMEQRKEVFLKQFMNEEEQQKIDTKSLVEHLRRNFREMLSIKQRLYVVQCCMKIRNCFKGYSKDSYSSYNRYKWQLQKSQSTIRKEMDLRKFLIRQRVAATSILGLLSGRQSFFVDKMSQLIIREDDTETSATSSDNELSDWQRDSMNFAEKLANSNNQVDKRFVNLYIYRKAAQKAIRFGLNNDVLMSNMRKNQRVVQSAVNREFESAQSINSNNSQLHSVRSEGSQTHIVDDNMSIQQPNQFQVQENPYRALFQHSNLEEAETIYKEGEKVKHPTGVGSQPQK